MTAVRGNHSPSLLKTIYQGQEVLKTFDRKQKALIHTGILLDQNGSEGNNLTPISLYYKIKITFD